MSNTNPGCFTAIISALGLKPKTQQKFTSLDEPGDQPDSYSFPYHLRDDFLSPAEYSLYKVIKTMMGDHLIICPKVSLSDIFFVSRPHENRGAINKIDRKHVDFLICDPQTLKPRFAIELDDSSHQRPDRVERDEFVDGVFEAAGLPLIHLQAKQSYSTTELGDIFRQALSDKGNKSVSTPANTPEKWTSDTPPLCPKCGVPMILRTAERGSNAGNQFYGCKNYPKCREVIPV